MNSLPIIIGVVSVIGLLVSIRIDFQKGSWLFKPVAAATFIWAAISWGALDSEYGNIILIGLILCWFGDVFLIPKGQGVAFQAGIASFLLGHVAFAYAFFQFPFELNQLLITLLTTAVMGFAIYKWLAPNLSSDFIWPVRAYLLVIFSMVSISIAAYLGGAHWLIPLGAVIFAISDLFVARERFVSPSYLNSLLGLPLYFGAQFVIAGSIMPSSITPN